MNAFYFTVGILCSTDNHNSLLQKLNKSLHHGAFSDTTVFLLKTCFFNRYLHLDKCIVFYMHFEQMDNKSLHCPFMYKALLWFDGIHVLDI